ncbi:DUF2339 domain-containing protein [Ohtaekwangia koreensis]|uniref:Predicted membrane protein n=1 Tax=Ohtaekwangia koreensis TaxID=688867 RepID=A0A1T5JFD5_9BACT|nr:DUF2339 domain-containing protein [Ohtaekwangia koreensis]SKC50119.1 Predicted membrane protein [Ohtaekwangia koreensis]
MEFLLFLVFLILLITLILLISVKNSFSSQLQVLQQKMDHLARDLVKLQSRTIEQTPVIKTEEKSVAPEKPIEQAIPVIIPVVEEKKEIVIEKVQIEEVPIAEPEVIQTPVEIIDYPVVEAAKAETKRPYIPPAPRKPGFFERNPDLEKFIGENLANKIGIGILVLGIGFFVKYAIDQDWINEIGRVFIGIACGGILIGVAHYMRKAFAAFSSVLVGGGIAILYLTIGIAFHEYNLFTQTAAFVLMVVITGFAIVLSLAYNRIELAVLAILGGFASPFMVSTGEGNYIVLFTYILILDVGMLVLAYYKKWNLVNIIAYIFTLILFGSWLAAKYEGNNVPMMQGAIIFATLFYLVFFMMNIINNIRNKTAFKSIEITLLLSNTFCYYAAGMIILDGDAGSDFKGLFTAALGIFNFIFAYTLYKNERVDRNLVFLLIGLVLTFISLAAPVQLEGNYITLFWAAEAVLLLWLSQKSGIRLMKLASLVVMALMIISLLMDWEQLYFGGMSDLAVIVNKAYITGLVVLASIAGTIYFLRFETSEYLEYVQPYRLILSIGGIILLYASQFFELQYQLPKYIDDFSAVLIVIGSYNMLFITGLLLAEKKLILPNQFRQFFAGWGVVAIASFLFFYHGETLTARNNYLQGFASITGFAFHYVYIALVLLISIITLRRVRQLKDFNEKTHNAYSWFYIMFFIFLASAELDHTVLLIGYSNPDSMYHIITQNHKIGFPILWGIASFLLIAIGLKTKKKHLRIISLSLLLVTLLKLFIVDIRGISEGGKIAAFISLGVLLLVVSFMYQRLKKLLLVDEPVLDNTQKEEEA